jgi:hypothetical protein
MGGMGGRQRKNTPLECILKNFKREFNGNYRVKLTPDKFRSFCEIDWPAFGVRWPLERSLDKVIVNRVFEVVVGSLDIQIGFFIFTADRLQSSCQPTWLKAPSRESM